MGQCVSQEPMFPHRQAILAPACNASVSDTSHDNHSHAEFSDSTLPENSNLDDLTKLDATSEYYDGVTRKHPTRKSLGKASIASFLPKVKGSSIRSKSEKDNHLSAAFNMSFNKFEVVRLDVNTATEEELMTLTGITRNIAHTIIEHRNVIGAFKKVEDLALVTGVGAAKLQTIKPEICIGKKVPSSTASIITGNPSINSLNGNAETISIASSPKPDRPRRQRRRDPVNINTASIFQLMTVDGITQELAAHLVHYREKKGPFKTLYDLRKVTGFNTRLISALGPYLALESSHLATPNGQQQTQNGNLHSHRRTASLPSGPLLNTGGFIRPTSPLLSSPSPVFPSLSQFTRVLDETQSALDANDAAQSINGDPVEPCENGLRILSWNLDGLSVEKAQNPGVVNVVGNLLTRYHIKIAIIEGIEDPLGLKELCENINKLEGMSTEPYLCTTTDGRVGYLHRVALQAKDSTSCTQLLPIHLATVEYFNVVLALVSFSLTNAADNTSTALVPQLVKSIMDLSRTERILCMVDLSQTNHSLYVEEFQNLGYRPVVPKGESTCYLQRKSEASKEIYSNILVSRYSQKGLTGSCGVIRNGLTHILIPNGWSWNGPVSMFCPIWVEFKEDEEGD